MDRYELVIDAIRRFFVANSIPFDADDLFFAGEHRYDEDYGPESWSIGKDWTMELHIGEFEVQYKGDEVGFIWDDGSFDFYDHPIMGLDAFVAAVGAQIDAKPAPGQKALF